MVLSCAVLDSYHTVLVGEPVFSLFFFVQCWLERSADGHGVILMYMLVIWEGLN